MSGRSKDIAGAYGAAAITPSDSTVIPVTRGVYVGVTGDVAVRMADGTLFTFVGAGAGEHPWQVTKVLATGTTATSLGALY
jgi:hypothetical protein